MIINIFKKARLNWPIYLLVYLLVLKSIWVVVQLQSAPDVLQNEFLTTFLPQPFAGLVSIVLASILVFFLALLANGMSNRHHLMSKPTNLVAMSVVLVTCLGAELQGIGLPIGLFGLSLLIYNKLFKATVKEHIETNVFDVGALIGVGSLLFLPYIGFFVAFVLAIPLLSIPRKRYYGVALFGFLLPWYVWAIYLFMTNQLHWFEDWLATVKSTFLTFPAQWNLFQELPLLFILLLITLLFGILFARRKRIPPSSRVLLLIGVFFTLGMLAAIFAFPEQRFKTMSVYLLGVCLLLANTYYYLPTNLARLLHWLCLIALLIYPVLNHLR